MKYKMLPFSPPDTVKENISSFGSGLPWQSLCRFYWLHIRQWMKFSELLCIRPIWNLNLFISCMHKAICWTDVFTVNTNMLWDLVSQCQQYIQQKTGVKHIYTYKCGWWPLRHFLHFVFNGSKNKFNILRSEFFLLMLNLSTIF